MGESYQRYYSYPRLRMFYSFAIMVKMMSVSLFFFSDSQRLNCDVNIVRITECSVRRITVQPTFLWLSSYGQNIKLKVRTIQVSETQCELKLVELSVLPY